VRIALSLAINREEISEILYQGFMEPVRTSIAVGLGPSSTNRFLCANSNSFGNSHMQSDGEENRSEDIPVSIGRDVSGAKQGASKAGLALRDSRCSWLDNNGESEF
jgi:ABC-type transport system substrate-binding protein